ncbi:MAG: hypothetical protein U0V70_03180 [Terriglobia bacterium]
MTMYIGFTPDGRSLVEASGSGKIRIWDIASGTEARVLHSPPKQSGVTYVLRCAALSPDGKFLAVSTYSSAEPSETRNRVMLWDVTAGRPLGGVVADSLALAFSPDGQWLALGHIQYGGGQIRIYRTSELRSAQS